MAYQPGKRASAEMEAKIETPQRTEGIFFIAAKDQAAFIKQEREKCIQALCLRSKRLGRVPTATDGKDIEALLHRLNRFLRWLESSIEITPELKTTTMIDRGLQLIYTNPNHFFDEATKTKARELYERWEDQNWGRSEVGTADVSSEGESSDAAGADTPMIPPRRKASNVATTNRDVVGSIIRPPPNDHAIFGINGIMHGTVQKKSANRKDLILDTRYQKRDFKVFGHNSLTPGDWWPMLLVALFNGAHGSKQGGISGNFETGAYSILVSGHYDDLDQDNGEVLYYSGSNSHENDDPNRPGDSSRATQALRASLRTRHPVRVLRASGGKSRWAPVVGYRYDGLYRVISEDTPLNKKGGMYERFKLEREPDQIDLDTLRRTRPSPREREDFGYIKAGY